MTTTSNAATGTGTDLHVHTWGQGESVVALHGSLATAAEEWEVQRGLVDEGFRFLAPDRRGYGLSPAAAGEDLLRDAEDAAALLDGGAHLLGHSYGGLGALVAAARHPERTRSLALLEPAAFHLGGDDPAARLLESEVRGAWDRDASDEEWVVGFLTAVGSDPSEFPPEFLGAALPLVPVVRGGRPAWEADLPFEQLAAAAFPKLVVSGGHSDGFEAFCGDLAGRIGAERAVVTGAGHEVQLAGEAINDLLLGFWRRA